MFFFAIILFVSRLTNKKSNWLTADIYYYNINNNNFNNEAVYNNKFYLVHLPGGVIAFDRCVSIVTRAVAAVNWNV